MDPQNIRDFTPTQTETQRLLIKFRDACYYQKVLLDINHTVRRHQNEFAMPLFRNAHRGSTIELSIIRDEATVATRHSDLKYHVKLRLK